MTVYVSAPAETDLSPAEQIVLQRLIKWLEKPQNGALGPLPPWEIYVRPYLNGINPSLVLMNPEVGIALIEVSELGNDHHWLENPLDKLARAKNAILSMYCPQFAIEILDDPRAWSLISTNLVVTDMTQDEVDDFYDAYLQRRQANLSRDSGLNVPLELRPVIDGPPPSKYREVLSLHKVIRSEFSPAFPSLRFTRSRFMDQGLAGKLREWLSEEGAREQSGPYLSLDADQEKLVNELGPLRRRVRGPAGSGKSQALAARASLMSGQFESVLVLTFNITLWHYLLNLAKQHKNPNARIHSSIEWNHFHQWCIDRCFEAGLGSEYRGLWKHHPDRVLEHDLPELTRKALQITGRKYDAILIDEGQDFHIAWWNVVRSTLRARGGKVFLVADRTQDLYEKAGTWVEAENEDRLNLNWTETDDRKGTGFRTDWHDLTKSYRLPFPVIHRLRAFAENYLADAPLLPEAPGQGELWPCSLRWIQVTDERTLERAVADSAEELLDKLSSLGAPLGDLVVMTCTKETGRRCVSEMRIRRPSVKIQDTFVDARQACSGIPGKDWQCQNRIHQLERLKKIAFIETGDSLRITTIKSFKGWEARAVIAVIESGQSVADLREAYVALTRVKRDEHGSFITVICAEPSLRGLGSTWNVDYPGQL